jgi:hypothetical protein
VGLFASVLIAGSIDVGLIVGLIVSRQIMELIVSGLIAGSVDAFDKWNRKAVPFVYSHPKQS